MNKHILLVMKWLNDEDSVNQDELEKNKREASDDYYVASATYDTAVRAAYWAATATTTGAVDAAYWVNIYFKRTGEDRNEYEKELEK
jgi:hypothetical protein